MAIGDLIVVIATLLVVGFVAFWVVGIVSALIFFFLMRLLTDEKF